MDIVDLEVVLAYQTILFRVEVKVTLICPCLSIFYLMQTSKTFKFQISKRQTIETVSLSDMKQADICLFRQQEQP